VSLKLRSAWNVGWYRSWNSSRNTKRTRSAGYHLGEVILAHIKDEVWIDGKIDPRRLKVIGRVGANLYSKPGEIFELKHSGVKP